MLCWHLSVVFLNLFPSLFSVALVFIKAGPMGFCCSVVSLFKSLLAPLSQCMLNYKGLELVPFPKELFTHTDISFAESLTTFEGPSVWGHMSVPLAYGPGSLAPIYLLFLSRTVISNQKCLV